MEMGHWAEENLSPPRILAKLNDLHGKEHLNVSFKAEARLRHVLLPLCRRGWLSRSDQQLWSNLRQVCRDFRNLDHMLTIVWSGQIDRLPASRFLTVHLL